MGTRCASEKGRCSITGRAASKDEDAPTVYLVEFDGGRKRPAKIPETELTPLEVLPPATPLDAAATLDVDAYDIFRQREALVAAWNRDLRDGQGAKALLSSRIDLRPHQAYVAASVLLDRQRRYLLADEVGLGKTIEAGIVIHDLLRQIPAANILVLCPGSLTHQWLCEMYSKFCGRVFKLPELRARMPKLSGQVILSFSGALALRQALVKSTWDLVVLDEAHNLLAVPQLYALARGLSARANGLLLLSALPAQRREDEYLRLLALLEPDKYDPDSEKASRQFKQLYDRQLEIGQKLRYISRRLDELSEDPESQGKALGKVQELAALPVLENDPRLKVELESLKTAPADTFASATRRLLHYIGDTYRINRRILRNRRSRLIAADQLQPVQRKLARVSYAPDQLELDVYSSARGLLNSLHDAKASDEALLPLARQLLQSLTSPATLADFLDLSTSRESTSSTSRELFALDSLAGYDEWPAQVRALWSEVKPPQQALGKLRRAANAWAVAEGAQARLAALIEHLRSRHASNSFDKFLIFAGFPGLAERLAGQLARAFGRDAVARFHFGMPTPDKEDEARRFKNNTPCWLLVSDETGGEGRNFQFAAELVHYDLPWNVSRVEQRIGRLDRLGRTRADVIAGAIVPEGTANDALLECLEKGFEVFTASLSGLEFALRDLERRLVLAAMEGDDSLRALAPEIKAAADDERAQDEAQEVLDEASNGIAIGYRQLKSSPEREKSLEQAFASYFRSMSDNDSVWWMRDAAGRPGMIRFRPSNLRNLELPLARDSNGDLPEFSGTFYRAIAQDRPDAAFFSVGNEFCDAFLSSLSRSVRGRTYAIECRSNLPSWRGFEISYRIGGDAGAVAANPGLLNQLDRIFALPLVRIFIGEDGKVPGEDVAATLLSTRRKLDRNDRGRTWSDLGEDQDIRLDQYYEEWPSLVSTAERTARQLANSKASEALASVLSGESAKIASLIDQAKRLRYSGWKEEVASLELFLESVSKWHLDLECVGFLSINGEIVS